MTGPQRHRDIGAARVLTAAGGDFDARDRVRGSLVRLMERFRPELARSLDAAWRIRLRGHTPYTVRVRDGRCMITAGGQDGVAATLVTDPGTWLALVAGEMDGLQAFMDGRLEVRGDLNLALRLETMFAPGPDASRGIRTLHTDVKGVELESFVTGHGTPVLLLHGLAASKISFVPTLDGLADGFEVHALDLPGFGKSGRPLPHGKRYSPAWMARAVRGYMVRNHIPGAYVVGNSMGGRIALELALQDPRQIRGIVQLCPAVAFDEYQPVAPLVRLIRGQWIGLAPLPKVRRSWIEAGITELFHDPEAVPRANVRAAAEEVQRDLQDRGYRLAVAAAARWLGGERATGDRGYWERLRDLQVPSLWVFGDSDVLVHRKYAARVADALPHAQVQVWERLGHVPQFEAPDRTNDTIRGFLTSIEAGY